MLPQEDKNSVLRRELLAGTIKTVADIGLENTTTNAICQTCGVNVAYIYRFFADKEDLIAKAFDMVDRELMSQVLENFTVLHYQSIDYESRCRVLFTKCWNYLMRHPQELTFYVHYYYSASFSKYSQTEHLKRYTELFEKMKTAFPSTVDVKLVMHHILNTLLCEARQQIANPAADDGIAGEKCFRLIFSVVKSCVKQEKLN